MIIANWKIVFGAVVFSTVGFLYAVHIGHIETTRSFAIKIISNFMDQAWSNVDEYYSDVIALLDETEENTIIPPFRRSSLNQTLLETQCADYLPTLPDQSIGICTYPEDNWARAIKKHEVVYFEKTIVERMCKTILPRYPDADFLDLGSFIGVYGLTAAAMGRKVFAFDPTRSTIDLLSTSVKHNGLSNFNLFPFALGKNRGCIVTKMQGKNHYAMTFAFEASCDSEGIVTPVITLDYFINTLRYHGVKRAIMKIDVERYEPYAIIGGERFLREIDVPLIQMEWRHMRPRINQETGEPNGADVEKMMRILTNLGYKPFNQNSVEFTEDRVLAIEKAKTWTDDVYWVKL